MKKYLLTSLLAAMLIGCSSDLDISKNMRIGGRASGNQSDTQQSDEITQWKEYVENRKKIQNMTSMKILLQNKEQKLRSVQ